MVQVNRVCLKILFINRPQFLVDSNALFSLFTSTKVLLFTRKVVMNVFLFIFLVVCYGDMSDNVYFCQRVILTV